jgi:hypothetical protein
MLTPMLDRFIPKPRLVELDHVEVAARPEVVDRAARELDLSRSPLVRALFSLRTLPSRWAASTPAEGLRLRIGDIGRGGSGFAVLEDEPGRLLTVGAIGRFWEPDIPFLDVPPGAFATFAEPGYGKIAWQLRLDPIGDNDSRVTFELRLDATDDAAWTDLRRYYRLITPFSHFIRRHALALLRRELGATEDAECSRPLPGDELLPQGSAQTTHGITIEAPPAKIWPWLVQMGCGRAGWYSHDALDNAGHASARVIVPALQHLELGQVLPASPDSPEGFTVLAFEPERFLVLGAAYDTRDDRPLEFFAPMPERYFRSTWSFSLLPHDATHTRLVVRARVDFEPLAGGARALWLRPVHHFMESEQLRNLAARVEGTLPHHHDGIREIGEGLVGIGGMLVAFATPFRRRKRSHWGLSEELAAREYPGDSFLPNPQLGWTHGQEIDAPPEAVWPWVAQLGADKAGFYSYQWLENLAGLDIQNADHVVDAWQHPKVGDLLRLHAGAAGIPIVALEPGRLLLAQIDASTETGPKTKVSWLFFVEPISGGRSRLISRFRMTAGDTLVARLIYGPIVTEPVGFAMDRKMLSGIRERAERKHPSSVLGAG